MLHMIAGGGTGQGSGGDSIPTTRPISFYCAHVTHPVALYRFLTERCDLTFDAALALAHFGYIDDPIYDGVLGPTRERRFARLRELLAPDECETVETVAAPQGIRDLPLEKVVRVLEAGSGNERTAAMVWLIMIGWHYSSTCPLGKYPSERVEALSALAARSRGLGGRAEVGRRSEIAWWHFHNVGPPPTMLTRSTLGEQPAGWRPVTIYVPDEARR